MSAISAISSSGMSAAQAALDAAAHNIANLSTAGFRRQEVTQTPLAGGGVAATVSTAARAGDAPENDLVAQLVASNQFLANLAVFKTSDRMTGALLRATG
jgi:flagellar hook-associated protein FlgK